MKKNYIYFVAPLVALVIFAAIYWNFSKGLEKREATRIALVKKKKEDDLAEQARKNQQAINEALAAQAHRKAEREAKEAKDKADKDARTAAVEAKEKAYRDSLKLAQQVEHLENEVQTEKDAIAKLEDDKKKAIEEKAFLKEYVKAAQENVRSLMQVIDRIAVADAARAAADAEAARNKKNS